MQKRILAVAVLAAVCAAGSARAQSKLAIGDAAPKIEVRGWVKGEPVTAFQKGKLYVVEFWATWCGPCKVSIPHLTELQKKYKDVSFVGVSVWEQDQAGVKPFVADMGEKMAYRVAIDLVPAGKDGNSGKMAQGWMQAAGQNGIPTAFIINGDAKIAWIGHPMEMEKPLAQVVAGKWDLTAAAADFKKAAARQEKLQALGPKVQAASKNGPKAVLEVLDKAIAEDAGLEEIIGFLKFNILSSQAGDVEKAAAYGKHLVADVLKDDAQALNNVAWSIVDPERKPAADAKLVPVALMAAKRADTLAEGKDVGIADSLAKALFDSGEPAKAVEVQERALRLAEGTDIAKDPGLRNRLEQYRKAAQKQ